MATGNATQKSSSMGSQKMMSEAINMACKKGKKAGKKGK